MREISRDGRMLVLKELANGPGLRDERITRGKGIMEV